MSITIKTFCVNPLGENCYVVSDRTGEGIIIDCGCFSQGEWRLIQRYLDTEGIQLKHSLQTHLHFDHVMGAEMVFDYCQLRPEAHAMEQPVFEQIPDLVHNLAHIDVPLPQVKPDYCLWHDKEISFGQTTLRVLHTPGHTPGGVSFYIESEDVVFSGDTLFQCSLGRTDFPGGSMEQEVQSLRNVLLPLPPATIVYPGHGPTTSIQFERDNNPFL